MANIKNYILILTTDFATKTSKNVLLSLIYHCSDSPPVVPTDCRWYKYLGSHNFANIATPAINQN